jgi:jumonji domain-containing protein 7
MTFDRFVRSGLPQNNRDNVSFYIEYFPISLLKKIAKKDLKSLRWSRVLDPTMQLLWMGVGGPRKNSRLHFDAYENIMVVAAGTKTFRLFDPSQSANVYGDTLMRSATIQAEYRVEEVNYTCPIKSHDNCWIEPGVGKYIFSRPPEAVDPHLYSHTYSPVDISRPDYVQFPKLKEARSFNCTIRAGDALYIPSYWWHEVLTYDDEEHKSIGINYFFDPYYQRSRKGDATYLTRSAVYEHFRNQLGDAKGGSVVPCESKYMCLAKGINTDDKDEVSGTASGSSGQSKKKSGPKVKRKVEAIRDKRGSRKKATSEL